MHFGLGKGRILAGRASYWARRYQGRECMQSTKAGKDIAVPKRGGGRVIIQGVHTEGGAAARRGKLGTLQAAARHWCKHQDLL